MKNKTILIGIAFIFLMPIVFTMSNEITQTNSILDNNTLSALFETKSTEEKVDIIVNFKEKIDKNLLEKSDIKIKENIESIDVSAVSATQEAIEEIISDPDVESVELDIDLELFGEEQIIPWGIEVVNAPKSWDKVTGKNIKIAILDTGIDKYHEDLEIKNGISFIDEANYWDDDLGHGTSVSGVISALNNGIGVVGVAPEAEIYSIKVMGTSGGKLSNIIQGIQWAIDNDMDIIVMSLGIPVDSPSLKKIVDEAYLNEIILIAASGKNNEIYYPAKYSSVIAVGSINENNELTNENGAGEELEFVAPGENIISTSVEGYGSFDGTSMAAPHVAGIAALLKEENPDLTSNEIRAKLQRNAIDLGEEGKDDYFGYGLVQVNLENEDLSAIIQIVFPEEKDETKKEEYEINPIKVEIIKIENEEEKIIQTLFYDGNQRSQNISVEAGQYKVNQYFDDQTYSDEYVINEGDILVVPLHKTNPPIHQWIAYQASFIWSTNEIMEYMEEEKYNSQNVWNMEIDPFLDDDGYNNYKSVLGRAEGILVGSGEEDEDTQGDYKCLGDYHGNPYCYHFWEPDNPQNGNYNDGILIYGSAMVVAQVQYNRAVDLYSEGEKDESYYWLGRVAHLITDMTVPAHVHLDQHVTNDDAFEDFMSKKSYWSDASGKYNFRHFNGGNYAGQQYNHEEVFFWSDAKSDPSNLFRLFWYTAQKTQYYASDNWDASNDIFTGTTSNYLNNYFALENGDCTSTGTNCRNFPGGVDNTYLWDNEINNEGVSIIYNKGDIEDNSGFPLYNDIDEGPNLAIIAEANIPHAMKAVAGLYRLFWAEVDADGDNINNLYDNCVYDYNLNQENNDADSEGDVCDSDDDNDGYLDGNDAFPFDSTEWLDTDSDGIGDNADTDDDNDGILDNEDAFPKDPTEWSDNENDGIGDNADLDDDNDNVLDLNDSCSFTYGQDYEQGCPDLVSPEVTLNLSNNLILIDTNITITCEVNDTDPDPTNKLLVTKPSNETVSLNCSSTIFNDTSEEGNYIVYFEAVDHGNNSANVTEEFSVDSCIPNFVKINETCQNDDTFVSWFNDTNKCYEQTGLDLDKVPENITSQCDFCEPNWTQTETCQLDDSLLIDYVDLNNCYAQTGLENDSVGKPENSTKSCGQDYYSDNYCEGNGVYRDLHDFFCLDGGCGENESKEAAQSCKIYDDFSSQTLNTDKWEVKQDYEGYPFTDEYELDTDLQNFHTKQNNMEPAGTFLVPKHKFLPGEVFEYDIIYNSGSGNRVSNVFVNNQNRFGTVGYWNGPENSDFGTHHVKLEFGENWIRFNDINTYSLSTSAPFEIYIGTRTGHNGLVHIDYDNFEMCTEVKACSYICVDGTEGPFCEESIYLNLTKQEENDTIQLKDENNIIIEFDAINDSTDLTNLLVKKQSNESSFAFLLIQGLDLTSQNKTKTVYLDKILDGTGLCIKDAEFSLIGGISSSCTGANEFWLSCPGTNGDYNCELVNNNTQYKISGLKHSGVKEQETYCGDGIVNGNEQCESGDIPKSCADYGHNTGSLSCTGSCTIDSSACYTSSGDTGSGGSSSSSGGSSTSKTTNNQTNKTTNQTIPKIEFNNKTIEPPINNTFREKLVGITGGVIGTIKENMYSLLFILVIGIIWVGIWVKKRKKEKEDKRLMLK